MRGHGGASSLVGGYFDLWRGVGRGILRAMLASPNDSESDFERLRGVGRGTLSTRLPALRARMPRPLWTGMPGLAARGKCDRGTESAVGGTSADGRWEWSFERGKQPSEGRLPHESGSFAFLAKEGAER